MAKTIPYNSGIYVGEIDHGLPHGLGTWNLSTSDPEKVWAYRGAWDSGEKAGMGIYSYEYKQKSRRFGRQLEEHFTSIYCGPFKDGHQSGIGFALTMTRGATGGSLLNVAFGFYKEGKRVGTVFRFSNFGRRYRHETERNSRSIGRNAYAAALRPEFLGLEKDEQPNWGIAFDSHGPIGEFKNAVFSRISSGPSDVTSRSSYLPYHEKIIRGLEEDGSAIIKKGDFTMGLGIRNRMTYLEFRRNKTLISRLQFSSWQIQGQVTAGIVHEEKKVVNTLRYLIGIGSFEFVVEDRPKLLDLRFWRDGENLSNKLFANGSYFGV
jgi:hypothetical protein